jgi:hypothetical protein
MLSVLIKLILPRELKNALPKPNYVAGFIVACFTIAPVKALMINK